MDLDVRARHHAALGDPLRLAVVDALALADASPGDLGRQLGIAANLLAHHLRVLEEAEIVVRRRSEGDGRRSYVCLRLDNPLLAGVAAPGPSGLTGRRVVFVCTHNSARSQLAASVWRTVTDIPVASAGTHPAHRVHPGAVRAARRRGLSLDDSRTRQAGDVVTSEDLVVAVCDQVHEALPRTPRLHWSVRDPVRSARAADFNAALDEITLRVGNLARAVQPPVP